jgi:dTMP kinase
MSKKLIGEKMLIAVEGGEGSGKTTISKKLHEYFVSKGTDSILIKEPGGTDISDQLRDILLNEANEIFEETELFLFFASFIQSSKEVILPALDEGKVVICDRFVDSNWVYQVYKFFSKDEWIDILARFQIPYPYLTFVLHIDPKTGLNRSIARLKSQAIPEMRFENKGIEYHKGIAERYYNLSKFDDILCHKIDIHIDNKTIDEVFNEIVAHIKKWY